MTSTSAKATLAVKNRESIQFGFFDEQSFLKKELIHEPIQDSISLFTIHDCQKNCNT